MANMRLPSWAKEDEQRATDSIVQALISHGVADASISTNGYVFSFEYKGKGARFCNQSFRLVGTVYASFQEMQDDENDERTIGRIYAEKGGLVANVSAALEQVEAGGLQDEDDKYGSSDDYSSGCDRDIEDDRNFRDDYIPPARRRDDEDWHGKTQSEAKRYAHERNESGTPRWMEPFAKYDMFGKPTVFHSDFGRRSRR